MNSSATNKAALNGWREHQHEHIRVHLSQPVAETRTRWVIELRRVSAAGSAPLLDATAGEVIRLAPVLSSSKGPATLRLIAPFHAHDPTRVRLWIADLDVPGDVLSYAARFGQPIRYDYVPGHWPIEYYQTIFAQEPGSAEMPSAGRAFTRALVARLQRLGIAPLVLHTGVGSLDVGEAPYAERYRVPAATALAINAARAAGHRVVAVGTTVVPSGNRGRARWPRAPGPRLDQSAYHADAWPAR
ncbi:MAG: S-adenosylmethionine:tRNA ribosyltransferase-isomerase [Longimicrobiales bacterium]